MSRTWLGDKIDIHGGGRDLLYPHHENEIAQSECATGKSPFCGCWMHNGMLQLDGVKMSKSLGNLVLARNLMAVIEPDHLRLYLLSQHYRTDANYHDGDLTRVSERYGRFKRVVAAAERTARADASVMAEVRERLDDDFDTPGALDAADRAAVRVANGNGVPGEREAVRDALALLGFAFAGARGPANGNLNP